MQLKQPAGCLQCEPTRGAQTVIRGFRRFDIAGFRAHRQAGVQNETEHWRIPVCPDLVLDRDFLGIRVYCNRQVMRQTGA